MFKMFFSSQSEVVGAASMFKRFLSSQSEAVGASSKVLEQKLVSLIKDGRRPPRQSHLDAVLNTVKSEADFAIGARSVRRAASAKVIRSGTSPSINVNQQRTSTLLSRAGTRSGQAKRVLEIFNARNEWSKMTMTSGAASYLFDHAATLSTIVPQATVSTPPTPIPSATSTTTKPGDAKSKDAKSVTPQPPLPPSIPMLPISPAAAFAEEVHALARAHGVKPSRTYTYSGVSAGLAIGGKTGLRLAVRIAMEGSKAPFHDGAALRLLGALWTGGVVEKATNLGLKSDGQVSSRLSLLRVSELEFLHRLVTSLAEENETRSSSAAPVSGATKDGGEQTTTTTSVEKTRPGTIIARLIKDELTQNLEKARFLVKSKTLTTAATVDSSGSTSSSSETKVEGSSS